MNSNDLLQALMELFAQPGQQSLNEDDFAMLMGGDDNAAQGTPEDAFHQNMMESFGGQGANHPAANPNAPFDSHMEEQRMLNQRKREEQVR